MSLLPRLALPSRPESPFAACDVFSMSDAMMNGADDSHHRQRKIDRPHDRQEVIQWCAAGRGYLVKHGHHHDNEKQQHDETRLGGPVPSGASKFGRGHSSRRDELALKGLLILRAINDDLI